MMRATAIGRFQTSEAIGSCPNARRPKFGAALSVIASLTLALTLAACSQDADRPSAPARAAQAHELPSEGSAHSATKQAAGEPRKAEARAAERVPEPVTPQGAGVAPSAPEPGDEDKPPEQATATPPTATAEPTTPEPKADPWGGEACVASPLTDPLVVLCRDDAAARAYAQANGDPKPVNPPAPEGLSDPVHPREGLDLHRSTRRRIAPGAKFTPIVFYQTPPFSSEQWAFFHERPAMWRLARDYWGNPKRQNKQYRQLARRFGKSDKATLRKLILRSGYLFTEDRRLARRIYKTVRLTHLFDDPEIFLQRGDTVYRLKRSRNKRRGYEYTSGPKKGRKAGILLFDRVATSPDAFGKTYHWDLQAMRRVLGLYTFDIKASNLATLPFETSFFSGERFSGVLFHRDGKTAMAVVGEPPNRWLPLAKNNRRRYRARARILDAAEAFADEWIRFDEPDIEFGQEDGKLRDAWIRAYLHNKTRYEINGVSYKIFNGRGHPTPPQVCVDFLMDAVERASGTWWAPRHSTRARTKGTIRWRDYSDMSPRHIPSVARFAKAHPEIFEVYTTPPARQVQFQHTKSFYRNLATFPVDFREADMIIIWGYREDGRRHYHSFFVHAIDPVDGFPIMLSDNAGLAAVRVWKDVMRPAPQRYVYRRLRLKDEWLLEKGLGD